MSNIEATELVRLYLPLSHSNIINQNEGMLWIFVFYGLEGLFRKDQAETRAYGRKLCDEVKRVLECDGFFTSDELPRYGIDHQEIRGIYSEADKHASDGKLIVLLAYSRERAEMIREFLIERLRRDLESLPPH